MHQASLSLAIFSRKTHHLGSRVCFREPAAYRSNPQTHRDALSLAILLQTLHSHRCIPDVQYGPRRLVDHRHCTLHSKRTFSRQTHCFSSLNVFFSSHCLAQDNRSKPLVTCICLSFFLDCLFYFLFPPWWSGGVLSRFSPRVCVDWWGGGGCLSRYLCCALVLYLHSLSVYIFKSKSYVWCRRMANTHPVWLWIPSSAPSDWSAHTRKCTACPQVLFSPPLLMNSVLSIPSNVHHRVLSQWREKKNATFMPLNGELFFFWSI